LSVTPLAILQDSMTSMHGLLDKAIADMTRDQLNVRPQEGGVSPSFSPWHHVRTEDNVVNWMIHCLAAEGSAHGP
jgi:hypothetical protein